MMSELFYALHLYILFSEKLDKYFVGPCINQERRFYEHTIGHSKFSSLGIPWKIVYNEEFEKLADVRKRELQIMKMKPRKYIEALIEKGKAS